MEVAIASASSRPRPPALTKSKRSSNPQRTSTWCFPHAFRSAPSFVTQVHPSRTARDKQRLSSKDSGPCLLAASEASSRSTSTMSNPSSLAVGFKIVVAKSVITQRFFPEFVSPFVRGSDTRPRRGSSCASGVTSGSGCDDEPAHRRADGWPESRRRGHCDAARA